jgi:hypothetical protein
MMDGRSRSSTCVNETICGKPNKTALHSVGVLIY